MKKRIGRRLRNKPKKRGPRRIKIHTELYKLLEFDKVLLDIQKRTLNPLARARFDDIEFLTELPQIDTRLTEVMECRDILEHDSAFPLSEYDDIRKPLEASAIEGSFLAPESLVHIGRLLNLCASLRHFLSERKDSAGNLWKYAGQIGICQELEKALHKDIDFETSEVKDSASPELAKIRKKIDSAEQQARALIDRLFRQFAQKGYLREDLVTFKDGRTVLPVKLEHKGRVKGLVHDQSATGSTLFVEPFEAVEQQNEIRRLQNEEAREIERILTVLTALVRNDRTAIELNLRVLVELDAVHAIARFCLELNCSKPALNTDDRLVVRNGRHPLLLLREKQASNVVPLDLQLGGEYFTLVITGPNAGGKTVALKTVGLLCLMALTGIPIPADPDSQIPVLRNIFADIGDFQSIEQDLSTFSSHVQRIKHILDAAARQSLVLVDEIGVGTDPDEGSALAQSFLEELTRRGTLTIVTTHHGALKAFAYNTQGVENGSMDFDSETLQPTYRFRSGVPGSSYAIEIAQRMGVSGKVLERCRTLIGSEKSKMESLILDLERKIIESDKLTEKLKREKARLEELASLYKQQVESLKKNEKSLKAKAIEEAEGILQQANAAIERAVKEIREKQASQEAIREAKSLVGEARSKVSRAAEEVDEEVTDSPGAGSIEMGAEVTWKGHGSHGTVVSDIDHSGKVLVQVDNLKVRVPVSELMLSDNKTEKRRPSSSVKVQTSSQSGPFPEVNVVGQTLEDALNTVDKFLDDALIIGWREVRIIHGKGTGVLRKGIAEYLEKQPHVKGTRMGGWNEGDIGVTVVELA